MILGLGASYTPNLLPKPEKENLVIAGKLGPEPEILANMYKILIEKNTDMTVTVKPNFGKTTFLYEALKKGDIAIYPEFTGTVTEVSSSRRRKSTMIQKQSIKRLEMGSRNKTT